MIRTSSRLLRTSTLAVLALSAGLLTSCAESEGVDTEADRDPAVFQIGMVGDETGGDPVDGGMLDVSAYTEVRSMDPVDVIANGLSGGSELAAIYDVLLRYDPEAGEYEGQLAEGVESNEDASEWTLTLRDGVTFSDGSPLDADAVVASIGRYLDNGGGQASLWSRKVGTTTATDERTVTFTLTEPWLDFPYMLATAPGMIVAPGVDKGGEFTPIGAGPFTFVHYRPGEELLLKANPDYFEGAPHLAELRFRTVQTAQGTLEVVQSGDADLGVLREPNVIKDAVDADLAGSMNVVSMGVGLIVNSREGRDTADELVRQAIAHTLDPDTIIQRSYDGVGLPGTEMFPEESTWHGAGDGPDIDLDEARELVEEAKDKGFDGTIGYLGIQKVSQNTGLAIEAMLGEVGIDVEAEYVPGAAEVIERVFVDRDFDLAGWSFGTPDAGVYPELFESFHSESSSNAGGYASDTMDGLIDDLGAATSEEEQQEILTDIQTEWNESIPAIVFGAQPELVAWGDQVGGIEPHVDSMVLYGDAWVTQ
ncbi:ABC transporter substrate-binding protein [Nocardioides sambongensis]|uniref:ABC transporter substrate-binding protein n=1 Tax=Nocardioides sambongensis TaxID=2589074 RepID=UPI00112D77F9|nr:ABC transporter substrate-binding protein [Nocardioides sambongensis]